MTRRQKTLATIGRLRDMELKAASRELKTLQDDLGLIDVARARIEGMRRAECAVRDPSAMIYTAGFLKRLHREDRRLADQETGLIRQVEQKRAAVLDRWRGVKAVETLAASIADAERCAREEGERAMSEELGMRAYASRARGRPAGCTRAPDKP